MELKKYFDNVSSTVISLTSTSAQPPTESKESRS